MVGGTILFVERILDDKTILIKEPQDVLKDFTFDDNVKQEFYVRIL